MGISKVVFFTVDLRSHQPPLKLPHKKRGAIANSSLIYNFENHYFTIDS